MLEGAVASRPRVTLLDINALKSDKVLEFCTTNNWRTIILKGNNDKSGILVCYARGVTKAKRPLC